MAVRPEPETGASGQRRGPSYADWKVYTDPEVATLMFPPDLAREALAPLRERFDPSNEKFGEKLWPDLARACVAFVRARHDRLAPITSGSPPRAVTVPQLLSQIRRASDLAVRAADELMRQALEPRERGEDPDGLRLIVAKRLSDALCLDHVPADLRNRIQSDCQPGEKDSPFGPAWNYSGFGPLISLRNEAVAIRREAFGAGGQIAGKSKGRHVDPDMRAFILELAHIYRELVDRKATAHPGNAASENAPASPLVRFIEKTISILERETIVGRPLPRQVIPVPRTIARYLERIDANRAFLKNGRQRLDGS